MWAFKKYFPDARSFLEFGCGTGAFLAALLRQRPDLEVTGTDIALDWFALARKRLPQAELLQMDVCNVPFREHFDVIGAFDVIEHVREDEIALREMRAALNPGGGILLTVPQHPWLWSPLDDFSGHHRRYRRAELKNKLELAGFSVVRMTSFVSFLVPILFLSRTLTPAGSRLEPEGELHLPRFLNAALATVQAAERGSIRAGASLPIGGSLLAVARRD